MENQENKVPSSFEVEVDRFAHFSEKEKELFAIWGKNVYTDTAPDVSDDDLTKAQLYVNEYFLTHGWENILAEEIKICPALAHVTLDEQQRLVRLKYVNMYLRVHAIDSLRRPIHIDLDDSTSEELEGCRYKGKGLFSTNSHNSIPKNWDYESIHLTSLPDEWKTVIKSLVDSWIAIGFDADLRETVSKMFANAPAGLIERTVRDALTAHAVWLYQEKGSQLLVNGAKIDLKGNPL